MVKNAKDGIITIDKSGIIQTFNPSAEKIFGWQKAEVIGKNVSLLMPEPYKSEHNEYLQKYNETGEAKVLGFSRELPAVRKDGSTFTMEISVSRMNWGYEPNFIGIVRDISERKNEERQLKFYSRELERSNRDLQEFAYLSSHDLQEPLRKIISFGDRLQEYAPGIDDKGRDYLRRMISATGRMQQFIDDLLKYSMVSTKEPTFEAVDLNEIVKMVESDLENQIKLTHGRIEANDLPRIDGSKLQMLQLFQNLISNGLKFRKDEEDPVISIKSHHCENGFLEISIEDNGIGFDVKHSEKIFKPFQRLHGRSK
ncbi:MAG: PAS domain S-box protein, partial [Candidatus Zixiibacteriota bacterium]